MKERIFYRRRIWARAAALFLGAALAFSGCSGAGGDVSGNPAGAGPSSREPGNGGSAAAMGRYMEQEAVLEENQGFAGMFPTEEGLYLAGQTGWDMVLDREAMEAVLKDSDGLPEAFLQRREAGDYFSNMAVAENGARMYSIFVYDKGSESAQAFYDKYVLLPDGREIPWEYAGREEYLSLWYGKDGYFYGAVAKDSDNGAYSSVYRVGIEDGGTEFLFDTPGRIYSLFVSGDYCFMGGREELYLYSLESKEQLEGDAVLQEAVRGSLAKNNGDYSKGFLIAPGEDGESIYLVTDEGLYRHVLYGSVMEQVIDGSLCSLGDISKSYGDMYVEEDGTGMPIFYFLYDTGRLVRFAYDETVPTLPETTMKLYSLEENHDIQIAISAYQAAHPELYIEYEVGMSEEDGVTREDALKNLATALAAGEGPDILVMDGLPYESYREKGVLMDLSGVYEELCVEQEFYGNIVDCFREEDMLCAIPLTFQVPVLCGPAEEIAGISDMESFLEVLKRYEGGRSSKAGLLDAVNTLDCFARSYGGSFLDETGELDREALSEFLDLCKRALEADREGADPAAYENRMEMVVERSYRNAMSRLQASWRRADGLMQEAAVFEDGFAVGGTVGGNVEWGVNEFLSTLRTFAMDYQLMPGTRKVCLPETLVSVNQATDQPGEAKEFVKYLLTDYLGTAVSLSGIPINKTVFLAMEENPYAGTEEEKESYASFGIGMEGDNGTVQSLSIEVCWGTPEEFQTFNALLESIDSVSLWNQEVMEAVYELGGDAVEGTVPIEEVVDEIEKKVQLYLAE